MEISKIKPILTVDKATLTFSAEKKGKIRVTYPGWAITRLCLLGTASEVIS
jgi:hypothetical protein